MSDIKFNVRKVFPGTEKQKAVGIYATFNMTIDVADGILCSLNDMKLCKSRAGEWYIQSPYRSYDAKDRETGEMKTRRVQFVKLWPEETNWSKQKPIVDLVRKAVEDAGTQTSTQAAAPPPQSSQASTVTEGW